MVALQHEFAEICGAPFRRDGPQYIRHILWSELAGRCHMIEMAFNFSRPQAAIHARGATRGGHERGPVEVNMSDAGAVVIVDGFRGARDDRHAEDRHRVTTVMSFGVGAGRDWVGLGTCGSKAPM